MMGERPWLEPREGGGAKRSRPTTRCPRWARARATALPIAPSPTTTTSTRPAMPGLYTALTARLPTLNDSARGDPMQVLIVNQAEVRRLLPMAECLGVMEAALAALARGEAQLPLRQVLMLPGGQGAPAIVSTPSPRPARERWSGTPTSSARSRRPGSPSGGGGGCGGGRT